jgi:hypothetical protein
MIAAIVEPTVGRNSFHGIGTPVGSLELIENPVGGHN